MAMSEAGLATFLDTIHDEVLRARVADAFSREYTYLSDLTHRIFELTGELDDLVADDVRAAQPDVVAEELRRCEVAVDRLLIAFADLSHRLGPVSGQAAATDADG